MVAKRGLIEPHKDDKRYVRRGKKGRSAARSSPIVGSMPRP